MTKPPAILSPDTEPACAAGLQRAHTAKSLSSAGLQTTLMFTLICNGYGEVRWRILHRPGGSTAEAGEGCRCRSWLWPSSRTGARLTPGKAGGATTSRSSGGAWKESARSCWCRPRGTSVSVFDCSTSSRSNTGHFHCICRGNELWKWAGDGDSGAGMDPHFSVINTKRKVFLITFTYIKMLQELVLLRKQCK